MQERGTGCKVRGVGAVERAGSEVARRTEHAAAETPSPSLKEQVMPASTVFTDEHKGYGDVELRS